MNSRSLYTKMKQATRKDKIIAGPPSAEDSMPIRVDAPAHVVLYHGQPVAWSYNKERARVAAENSSGVSPAGEWTGTGKLVEEMPDGSHRFTGYEVRTIGQLEGPR